MKTASAYEVKTHLSKLLKEAERGHQFVITRQGVEIAVLQPAAASPVKSLKEVVRRTYKPNKLLNPNRLDVVYVCLLHFIDICYS